MIVNFKMEVRKLMKIGCCMSLFDDRIFSLSQAGADYVEIGISELNGHSREEILQRADALKASGLSCLAGNLLFPGGMPLVGEAVDREKTADYLSDVLDKAALLGIHTIVFGSGKARAVPEGYSREKTWEQLRSLCSQLIAPSAESRDIVCCIEPLNRGECNILNTCSESARLVREVDKTSIRLLVDLYHFDLEREPRASLAGYRGLLAHAHIASAKNGRLFPQPGDGEDYASFFRALQEAGYEGSLSLEGSVKGDFLEFAGSSIRYLHTLF